ncbi:zinc finger protein 501-like isoform X1 [Cotesia glomerata]|uniref:zinc finger protein 501-like isoform X1 n=1 Tax=Cotesia glomerata TaxID=32391 RepID=UPI001D01AE15|nr:zinc finger protein 501-like isoform X1 [Cotesia glomerata]XP_044585017.1 zinc finger protein 501-like isoform X1 [Cotesia glomerata]
MPPKKSNLNNASTREARRKRVKRAHQLAEQIETGNTAQRIKTESAEGRAQEQPDTRLQQNITGTRAAQEQNIATVRVQEGKFQYIHDWKVGDNSDISQGFKDPDIDYPIDIEDVKLEKLENSSEDIDAPDFISNNLDSTCLKEELFPDNNKSSLIAMEKKNEIKILDKNSGRNIKIYTCDDCQATFDKKSTMQTHIKTHQADLSQNKAPEIESEDKPYSCDVCPSKFRFERYLKQHKRIIHTEKKRFSCVNCSSAFRTRTHLNRHMICHSGEQPYACDICRSQFRRRGSLKKHMLIHKEEKPYQCNICSLKFRHRDYLNSHVRIHSTEKPFACSVCSSQFRHRSTLNMHLKSHEQEEPCVCAICSAKFRNKKNLREHMRIHVGNKPHKCVICSARFLKKSLLEKHTRVHTKERPFLCNVCSSDFRQKRALDQHMKVHFN